MEGTLGAMVVLIAVLLSVQTLGAAAVAGPATDGPAGDQLRATAGDILSASTANGSLSRTVRYWNNSTVERTFARPARPDVGYGADVPPTAFGTMLAEVLDRRGYRFNVYVTYPTGPDPTRTETLVLIYRGVPSDHVVVATHPVTLYDGDRLTGPRTANETIGAANRAGAYPIPDVVPDSPLYAVVEVRLVVWR